MFVTWFVFRCLIAIATITIVFSSASASDRAKLRGRSAWAWASCQQCQPAKIENKEPVKETEVKAATPIESATCNTGNCSSYPMVGGGIFRMRRR